MSQQPPPQILICFAIASSIALLPPTFAAGSHSVSGYTRKDGTHVRPHTRSSKNTKNDNAEERSYRDEASSYYSQTPINKPQQDFASDKNEIYIPKSIEHRKMYVVRGKNGEIYIGNGANGKEKSEIFAAQYSKNIQRDNKGRIQRSASSKAEFKRSQPCPSTGKPTGSCPGYVVDHIIPLCAGGADDPGNMQWQELATSKAKDKQEWRQCRENAPTAPALVRRAR